MNAVVEVDKVRQIMDACPLQRLAGAEAVTDRLQQGGSRPDLGVAIKAGFGGRDPGKTGLFDRSMTITAVQSQSSHMVLMAERDWLVGCYMLTRDIRRALKLHKRCSYRREKKNDTKNASAS